MILANIKITDEMLAYAAWEAFEKEGLTLNDSPDLDVMIAYRLAVKVYCGTGSLDAICPFWLRNEYVRLRKKGLMPAKGKDRPASTKRYF